MSILNLNEPSGSGEHKDCGAVIAASEATSRECKPSAFASAACVECVKCSACGFELPRDAGFCSECGVAQIPLKHVGEEPIPAEATPPFSTERSKELFLDTDQRLSLVSHRLFWPGTGVAAIVLVSIALWAFAKKSPTGNPNDSVGTSAQTASRIITKDPEFMKLLHPLSGEALLEQGIPAL